MQTLSLERATRSLRETTGIKSRSPSKLKAWSEGVRAPLAVLACELLLAELACFCSMLLLSGASLPEWGRARAIVPATLLVSAVSALVATLIARLYRRSLRHANLLDVRTLGAAVALNALCMAIFVACLAPTARSWAALPVMDAAFLAPLWGLLHFGPRVWRAHRASQRKHGSRVVIVGAGDAGLSVLKEIALDPGSPFRPVALADDDPRKRGRSLYGVPVLGGTHNLAKVASQCHADEILVCIPSATHAQMHDILDACRRLNLPVRSLPSLPELIQATPNKRISPRDLRGPKIEYLIQRDAFQPDTHEVRKLVEGKTILVTGAGGSIGSELARQIAAAGPRKLLLLDKSENSLFYANLEIAERLGAERVKPILADLSTNTRVRKILKSERPEIVFHAAAHKHVSMIELHPEEAIRNNVLGTRNLAQASLDFAVGSFVNISTDKAVDPQNFMGLSKRITELCIQEFSRQSSELSGGTRFSNVRFGNVAGSTGSVIRLFWEQIQRGGPIRVTDPKASRYFMSISEAVHLILSAASLGRNGETFIFEMGTPFNIHELARTMALFSGLRPGKDIAIEFIGLRKGEKITEDLWERWERPVATTSRGILAIREKDLRSNGILAAINRMEQTLTLEDSAGLLSSISELFPAFGVQPQVARPPAHAAAQKSTSVAAHPVEAA